MPFRQLARWLQDQDGGPPGVNNSARISGALQVFRLHPAQLARFLEEVWRARTGAFNGRPIEGQFALSPPYPESSLTNELSSHLDKFLTALSDDIYPLPEARRDDFRADHLIYAYLVENTRIYEIMGRVLFELLHGERLATPDPETQLWMRSTEDLFFREPPPFGVTSVVSWVRPDLRATRRNAYYRMFGIDLNHGAADNRPYPYVKPAIANRQFILTWEQFLYEVQQGIENASNTSGANPTDDSAIANLARSLQDMLVARRGSSDNVTDSGNLSREEFFAVATMSWFHLSIQFSDSPIVRHLRVESSSPDERLRKIGERVGLPAHSRSYNYLQLAPRMSRILIDIEASRFSSPDQAPVLYRVQPGQPNPIRDDVQQIITHWSIATGRDIKARKTALAVSTGASAAAAGNGQSRGMMTREMGSFQPTYPQQLG